MSEDQRVRLHEDTVSGVLKREWRAASDSRGECVRITWADGGSVRLGVPSQAGEDPIWFRNRETAADVARAIATLPDMVEALRAVAASSMGCTDPGAPAPCPCGWCRAHAALRKAGLR